MAKFPLPIVEDDVRNGNVIEAVFLGDGLGFSGEVNRRGVEGAEEESEVNLEAKAWYDRGDEQYEQGDFLGAIASYNQAIALKPHYHKAFNNRGNAQYNLGQIEEAIASYNQAIAVKPDYDDALHNLALAQRKLGQIE